MLAGNGTSIGSQVGEVSMILIKLFILLFEFMLVSCNTNTIINHQTAKEESEFRSLRTQVISFPNKKSVLYSFSNPKTFLFDYNEFVYLTITKAQNGVDEFIKIESCEWDIFSCKTKGTKHLFSQNDQLNFFIENGI